MTEENKERLEMWKNQPEPSHFSAGLQAWIQELALPPKKKCS